MTEREDPRAQDGEERERPEPGAAAPPPAEPAAPGTAASEAGTAAPGAGSADPSADAGVPADAGGSQAEADVPPPLEEPAEEPAEEPPPAAPRKAPGLAASLAERPPETIELPRSRLAARTRRDFLLFALGTIAAAIGGWWLLPDRARSRLAPGAVDRLDTLAARIGLSRGRRERVLDRALTFDDDVAEALYSEHRRVRTYRRSDVTFLRNNYHGRTPGPGYLADWSLRLTGLAGGGEVRLPIDRLLSDFARREQVTRLVCVEGWSAVAWWAGIRFADLLAAFPPAPGARWAAMRSSVALDRAGRPDPYYVSLDLATARHSQTLLATHLGGRPLTPAHGAPLRLVAPMKLGLKNIKAVTDIAYSAEEPPDFWNERGYSKYDGL